MREIQKEIQIEDFVKYRFLSSLSISPGQTKAVFAVHQSDLKENNYHSALWLYRRTEQSLTQLTQGQDESAAVWLNDTQLLFASQRGKEEKKKGELPSSSFYQIDVNGGEAHEAFTIPLAVEGIETLGDGRFVVCACFDANAPDLTDLSEAEKQTALEAFAEEDDYRVMDELPFWRNGLGFTNKKRSRLFLYDPAQKSLEPLTPAGYQVNDWQLKEDKTEILFSGSQFEQIETLMPELALLEISQGESGKREKTVLVEEGKFDFYRIGFCKAGYFVAASDHKRFGLNENPCFYFIDAQSRERTKLSDPDFSMGNSVGSDNRYGGGKNFVMRGDEADFVITQRSCARLCAMDAQGETRMLTQAEGSIDCFDWKGELCLFVGMRGNALQELYRLNPVSGEEEQLSHFNEEALRGKAVITPSPINFVNKDGVEIDGWVLEPLDYDDSKSYPAILDIHGGPKTVYGTLFFHEMQVWASEGYFVMFCNPRGSDGRGNQFADIRGRYGKEDYNDIMEFVDQVLEIYPQILREELGVTGGSYGGFMTNWIIGHTDRFAAAAAQRSISNWVSMAGAADIGYSFDLDQVGGDAWHNLEQVWEQSPLKYADRCKTPTLFIHSDEDYRCWQAEALQMFSALKLAGVPTRICMFKGENHELSRSGKPKHRIRRLQEITTWLQRIRR